MADTACGYGKSPRPKAAKHESEGSPDDRKLERVKGIEPLRPKAAKHKNEGSSDDWKMERVKGIEPSS